MKTDSIVYTDPPVLFRSFNHSILHELMLPKIIDTATKKLEIEIENFLRNQSGWTVNNIENLTLRVLKLRILTGSSYIPLPSELLSRQRSGALLNIKNTQVTPDNDHLKCFLRSVLAKLSPVTGPNRYRKNTLVKTYKQKDIMELVNIDGIEFPMSIEKLPVFLERNPVMSISVFGYYLNDNLHESKKQNMEYNNWKGYVSKQRNILQNIFPLFIPSIKKDTHIDLLLLIQKNGQQQKTHFVLITDLNKFLRC